ncbi:hypothetical protein ACLOJK_027666 [Asimina triloba]
MFIVFQRKYTLSHNAGRIHGGEVAHHTAADVSLPSPSTEDAIAAHSEDSALLSLLNLVLLTMGKSAGSPDDKDVMPDLGGICCRPLLTGSEEDAAELPLPLRRLGWTQNVISVLLTKPDRPIGWLSGDSSPATMNDDGGAPY